eukprot:7381821-Prymnesium_polylepis.1
MASTATLGCDSCCRWTAKLCANEPRRETRARAVAPRCASQRAVSSPRPAVPPVTRCVLRNAAVKRSEKWGACARRGAT